MSVLLDQSINSFNTICHSLSGWTVQVVISDAYSATLKPFQPLVHLPLHNKIFSVLC
jgi:hypothetical protein